MIRRFDDGEMTLGAPWKLLKQPSERIARGHEAEWESINLDPAGFSIGKRYVDWRWIESVAVFKRDLLTFDDVWFQLEGAGEPVLVCEEQHGFSEWEAALGSRFPGVVGWRERVIQPAYAENFIVLYRGS
ncbi:MAG TPA: hypothetical protein PLB00_09185 [Pseudomonadota bacterium]|nr:hypothetical protein [Pseudomonadota bacterium]